MHRNMRPLAHMIRPHELREVDVFLSGITFFRVIREGDVFYRESTFRVMGSKRGESGHDGRESDYHVEALNKE